MLVAEFRAEVLSFAERHNLADREASVVMGMASNFVGRIRNGTNSRLQTVDYVRARMAHYERRLVAAE